MKLQNTRVKTRSAFIKQAEPAGKLEIGLFAVFMLIIAGAIGYILTL